jgi:hypothetical protein
MFKVFWDVVPFSHIEVDLRFGHTYCLHHQGGEWLLAFKFTSELFCGVERPERECNNSHALNFTSTSSRLGAQA